jgi:hypothetical protein
MPQGFRRESRIRILRQLGIGVIDPSDGRFRADERRIDQAFALDVGIFRLKFTVNFLMNLCSHLQIVSAFLIGGWWVSTDRLAIGSVVAFISGISRLKDPWGDLVNYFRDISVNQSSTACWRTRSTNSLASSTVFREPRCVELPPKRSRRRLPSKTPPLAPPAIRSSPFQSS